MKNLLTSLMNTVLAGALPRTLFILALIVGFLALEFTPREEEPQIVVPMVDVLVSTPGLSAEQTERQVTLPLERLLAEIKGVENIYSTSVPNGLSVTLRFFVGEDREDALLNTYNKLHSNTDRIPPVVSQWQVKPVEVDDVPILVLGLWSESSQYSDHELRRVADEFAMALQAVEDASKVDVIGGRPRHITLYLDPQALSARRTSAADIIDALKASNLLLDAGTWVDQDRSYRLETGDVLRSRDDLAGLIVNVIDGAPVFLRDVAQIQDGPAEPSAYTWIRFPSRQNTPHPMVAVSVAKKSGANAVSVAEDALKVIDNLKATLLPHDIRVSLLRNYGQTADDKVNNLTQSLLFAVVTVVVFIALFLGWRSGLVVGLAVPVCYGVALALDYALGYTINRVTLFALILSLGLLVDDPITGVDNISRFLRHKKGSTRDKITAAMGEISAPLVMSTLTIVLAFIPLAFITGMMGPYMAPMAFNVPVAVVVSTLTAFLVTPWLAQLLLRFEPDSTAPASVPDSIYARLIRPLIGSRKRTWVMIVAVVLLFFLACLMPVMRWVPLKLLPFDNRSEIQVLIDMPESASLERTAAVVEQVSRQVARAPEVDTIAGFVGVPSPMDFNGMVRRYYSRTGSNLGELRVVLVDKSRREQQSHAVVLRLRQLLAPLAVDGIDLKVVEVPPGPPVLATVVAEVYADLVTPYERQRQAARVIARRLEQEPHVVEVDSTLEADHYRSRFVTDKVKAALSGVATRDIAQILQVSNAGSIGGYLQDPRELQPLPIVLRLPLEARHALSDLERLLVRGRAGITKTRSEQGLETAAQPLVAVGELGSFVEQPVEPAIHRKDLRRVVYVTAEANGRTPGEVIADVNADQGDKEGVVNAWQQRTFLNSGGGIPWDIPEGTSVSWTGEGELDISLDVFRDMGLGYGFALMAIFIILRLQTRSMTLALIIMSAIPLTIIGIMPGFWMMNHLGTRFVAGVPDPVLFTATAMIGMIALAGIVVRNSLILVEFIEQARARGSSVRDAVLEAGAVRARPVLLTAGTTLLGNIVITLDPVFNGLALAIMFGIVASTMFTLVVVPLVYCLVFAPEDKTRELSEGVA